jgi:hypothetical protein
VFSLAGKRRALRRRKLVRLHVTNGPSLEGLLAGRRGGHYVLLLPKLLEAEGNTVALDGWVEVPAATVVFIQVLADGSG